MDDARAQEWDAFVTDTATASAYHLYAWRKIVRRVFGHDTPYFAAFDETGAVKGVLPLVRLRSRWFGDFLVSMPFFNYGGLVANSDGAAEALVSHAVEHARSLGVSHMELRHDSPMRAAWPVRTEKVAMHLRLPESADALMKTLGSKLRSQIKRPIKEGASSVSGGLDLLPEFYAVFARNMRDLGTPVYSRAFFREILEAFPHRARVFIVRLGGSPVAAGLVIGHRERLEIPWASSLRSANAFGVNMLLYWSALEFACQQGYKIFDFGRSTVDSGTYRFKRQWGAEPHQLYWHYWLRDGGELPRLNPANPKYRLAIAAWQRLPLPVANLLGPVLVKNLP